MRVRTDAKRAEILQVAAQVFREVGFGRASMGEIAARLGGSKATLYGYFASKEALFVEVAQAAAHERHERLLAVLDDAAGSLRDILVRYGQHFMALVLSPEILQAVRMVMGEAGNSTIGKLFYESGPERSDRMLSVFLAKAQQAGQLIEADPLICAQHLVALLNAEFFLCRLFNAEAELAPARIHDAVARAIDVFLRAYAP